MWCKGTLLLPAMWCKGTLLQCGRAMPCMPFKYVVCFSSWLSLNRSLYFEWGLSVRVYACVV